MSKKSSEEDVSYFGTLARAKEREESSDRTSDDNKERSRLSSSFRWSKPACHSPRKETTDATDDIAEENGVLFWVNKSGFPIGDSTWDRMWSHVSKLHPDGADVGKKIRHKQELPEIPMPQAPLKFSTSTSVPERLEAVQGYMRQLQYNHTGTQFFEIRKNRPLSGLMDSAREMIQESLPIKCLEAIILGTHLTNGIQGLERFAVSFKTMFSGHVHRHVVLGVHYAGRYGSIGMSRRDDLMYKPLQYSNLSDLVVDFIESYNRYWHEVKKVKIGLPIAHDPHSYEQINWKYITLNLSKLSRKEMCRELDRHAREARAMRDRDEILEVAYAAGKVEYTPHRATRLQVKTAFGGQYSPRKVPNASPRKENTVLGLRHTPGHTPKAEKSSTFYKEKTIIGLTKEQPAKTSDNGSYQVRI